MALRGQTDGSILVRGGHVRENVVCVAPGEIVGGRDQTRVGVESRRGVHGTNHCHALGVATRRTPQEKSAHETKHRGVHGDTQRQCENRSGCESWALQ